MYLAEIITRLYRSEKMKSLYRTIRKDLTTFSPSRSTAVLRQKSSTEYVSVIYLVSAKIFISTSTISNYVTRWNLQRKEILKKSS